jgi:hypothetical protein
LKGRAILFLEKNIFVLLLLAGLYFVPLRIFGPDFDRVPGDFGDARFNNYILEHGHQFLTGKISSYWNASFMYPEKDVISYSDNLLGVVPLYSVFRILSFDESTSLQFLVFCVFVLNFLCAYFVFKKFEFKNLSAAVGAYIFSFSLPVIGQINHLQVLPCFMVPWAFWGLINYFQTLKIKPLLICSFSLVVQFYCGMYIGFLLALALIIVAIIYTLTNLISRKRDGDLKTKIIWRHQIIFLLAAAVIFLPAISPLLKPYYERSVVSGMRGYDEIKAALPLPESYLIPFEKSVVWNFLFKLIPHPQNYWDHLLFPGGLALIFFLSIPVLLFIARDKIPHANLLVIFWTSLLILILLTMKFGQHDYSLFKSVRRLPGFSSMRAMNRVIIVELFFFAIISCFAVEYFISRFKKSYGLFILFPVLIVTDQAVQKGSMMSFSKKESKQRIENLISKIEKSDYKKYEAFVFLSNQNDFGYAEHIDAMLASQKLNFPTVNGYTASYPLRYYNLIWHNNEDGLQEWLSSKNINPSKILIIHND